jgi:teichuronic acid biosynthesis glycosyltransferase TuaG
MPREVADVSVIIPAYKAEATIGRALSSIASQTLMPAEIVIVDDGSNDNTETVIHGLRDKLIPADVIYVKNPTNLGAGATRNRAIAEASKTYLAFLDADDEWLPKKLERSMQVMAEGDFTLVAHDYLNATDDGDDHIRCADKFNGTSAPFQELYLKGYIPSISVLVRRQDVLDVNGFDTALLNAQDFELWLALLSRPNTSFIVFDEALVRYHHTPGSIMSFTERRVDCTMIIAFRYAGTKSSNTDAITRRALLFRLLIIHVEAIRVFAVNGRWLSILKMVPTLCQRMVAGLSFKMSSTETDPVRIGISTKS